MLRLPTIRLGDEEHDRGLLRARAEVEAEHFIELGALDGEKALRRSQVLTCRLGELDRVFEGQDPAHEQMLAVCSRKMIEPEVSAVLIA